MTERIRSLQVSVVFIALCILAGCWPFNSSIGRDESPVPTSAYIYGRFHIRKPTLNDQTMGFSIQCVDGKNYKIGFTRRPTVQLFAIQPSTCSLVGIIYTDKDNIIVKTDPAPKDMLQNANFAAGKAYYLGDFFAVTTVSTKMSNFGFTPVGFSISGNHLYKWEIKTATNNYQMTTTEMKSEYPDFAKMATEEQVIGTASLRAEAIKGTSATTPIGPIR